MDPRPTYTMYIDEFGHSTTKVINLMDDINRYLTVTGVIISRFKKKNLYSSMYYLKTKHGIGPTVALHRSDVENPRNSGPFAHLRPDYSALNPFAVRDAFYNDLIARLLTWDYVVVSVFIDKPFFLKTHTEDTYCFALRVLLDRFVWLLESVGGRGDIVYERRDVAKHGTSSSRNDARLEAAFADLLRKGTRYRKPAELLSSLSSTVLKPRRKVDNIPGLQIADFMAYASFFDMLGLDSSGEYPYRVLDRNSGLYKSIQPKALSATMIKGVLPYKYFAGNNGIITWGRVAIKQK